ncbi:MAG: UDP-N-acetylmuramoyl-L-alanyl-D-glutamate--2,6-diaminopimelate ligase [Candidatus Howiella sp.]|jgi:UDP-N-acetylmuramoyl-L-alanyl-D-glutamate--2,6-diaminopimelate ligase
MKFGTIFKQAPAALAGVEVKGLTCDSRRVGEGYVFVCISGAADDGHKYAHIAREKGAAIIVAQRDLGYENQVVLPDTRAAFAEMCAGWFGRPADRLKIIGVTGTNGKTTVSYLVKTILEAAGHKVGLVGTIQNMVGEECLPSKNTTPSAYELNSLFDLMIKAGCDYAVMEVSSHALDQKRVDGIRFETALFTNLTQDHLDYHLTMENYMAAKKRLFTMTGRAVVNLDDPYGFKMVEGLDCAVIGYSTKDRTADCFAENISYRPDGVTFDLVAAGGRGEVTLRTAGEFSVYNALCAAAFAADAGFSMELICRALSGVAGVRGRAEVVPTDRDFTIVIDYAHTPDGLENILKTFEKIPKNRLIALFGCGGDRDRTKRPKMGAIAAKHADFLIVTSDNPRSEEPGRIIEDIMDGVREADTPYVVIENRVEAIHYAVAHAEPGDIIVLAGKGHETYQVLSTGTIHLDEREVVADALRELK